MKAVLSASRSNYFSPLSIRSSFLGSSVISDMLPSQKTVRFNDTIMIYASSFVGYPADDDDLYLSDSSDYYVPRNSFPRYTLDASVLPTNFNSQPLSRSVSPVSDISFTDAFNLLAEQKQDVTPDYTIPTTGDSTPPLPSRSILSTSAQKPATKTPEKFEKPVRWKGPKKVIIGEGANQLEVPVRIQDLSPTGRTIRTKALLDSGCTGNMINQAFVDRHNIPTWPLINPVLAVNADGTKNSIGTISRVAEVRLSIGDHSEKVMFAVACLGDSDMYLGFTWLNHHNPEVDWTHRKLYFTRCPSSCHYHTRTIFPEEDEDEAERSREYEPEDEGIEDALKGEDKLESGDRVFLLDGAGYMRSLKQQREDTRAREAFAKELVAALPNEIRDYWPVFGEPGHNERLPERRPWDHAIDLTPDFKPVKAKLYPVPKAQQQELDEFIAENLRNGQIRESKSPMSSPFFFIKKADGSLRPVQDYRKLNEMTVKNRYPLPLISELLDKLQDAKYFSKVDIRWGFTNIRIKEGDEWKAAFLTNRGLYEPLVMFFGMCNAPATFQKMMNDIFKDLIAEGKIIVYMDDILIFTKTEQEHWEIVRRVLDLLKEHKLSLKVAKCDFCKPEIPFLGMIVGNGQIRMDPKKTDAISEWPELKTKKEVQQFLGFCNFYRRFIKDFSKLARPLTRLTGDVDFVWNQEQKDAFSALKNALCSSPVLAVYQDNLPLRVECDASEFALGAVLSQLQEGKWHPLAYYSKALNETERNYEIYDKELMAIVASLEEWRQYLLDVDIPVEIFSDHQNLGYFREPQKLNRRQARWFQELQDYNYTLHHKPGSMMGKPDAITRRPDLNRGESDNKNVTLLKAEHFRALALRASQAESQSFVHIYDRIKKASSQKDDVVIKALASKDKNWEERSDGVVEWRGRIYVPKHSVLRQDLLMMYHDAPMSGHPGQYKMHELITRDYWWPGISRDVKKYVNGCAVCQQNKPLHRPSKIPLSPHDIPTAPWEVISMDIIGPLPESEGMDAILVVVDLYSKRMRSIPCNTTLTAMETARLLRDHIFRAHGIPRKAISDRGPQFIADVMTELYRLLGIEYNPSSAAHPQTDGQTERLNQEIEAFLRIYTNYRQDDWVEWLAIQEFCYNNRVSSATGYSPFFLESGRNPNMGFNPSRHSRNMTAQEFFEGMKQSHEDAEAAMRKAKEDMIRWHDRKARKEADIKEGDKVWLETTNLKLERPSRKLSEKRLGPFEVLKKVGQTSYKLKLPKTWRVRTPVFHASLLYKYTPPTFDIQKQPDPPPAEVIDNVELFEVEEIVDSRIHRKKLQYRVHWSGYPLKKDWTWESAENCARAPDAIAKFHEQHPSAPGPQDVRSILMRSMSIKTRMASQNIPHKNGENELILWRSGRPP